MLACVEQVTGKDEAPSWQYYLEGLWWSGLRLKESLALYWNDETRLCVTDVDGATMLRVPAELEKGHKDRLLPIAPEFEEFLGRTPPELRRGRVFNPQAQRVHGENLTEDRVMRVVSKIGEAAKIVVDPRCNKYASAHDLRRSFGERWASRIMPPQLMELMRHESFETTLKYYVGKNARRTTQILREAYEREQRTAENRAKPSNGDTYGDTTPPSSQKPRNGDHASDCET